MRRSAGHSPEITTTPERQFTTEGAEKSMKLFPVFSVVTPDLPLRRDLRVASLGLNRRGGGLFFCSG